ncbi:MAG: hypothetical protein NT076_03535 [Candidatus Pacearchaeota archaeon]|nr:hypothetical protein [Candidatus Pacearchaeota archaeon]
MKGNLVILALSMALFVLMLGSFASAITGSIGNARMILYPEVGFWGTTIEKTILVKNVNNVSVNVSLEAANETFAKMVTILDSDFVLLSGENKNARFEINIKKVGDYEGKINVFFKPTEGKGSGVVLSSTIIIYATENGASDGTTDSSEENTSQSSSDNKNSTATGQNLQDAKKVNFNPLYLIAIFPIILIIILIFMLTKFNRKKKRR